MLQEVPPCILNPRAVGKQLVAPFVVYADFESVLKPISDCDTTHGVEIGAESSTTAYQEHEACSFAYKIVSSVDPDFNRPIVWYRGEDAAEKFIRDLQREAKQLNMEYIKAPKLMIFSVEDSLTYTDATACHICTKPLGDDCIRDHCHITGISTVELHTVYAICSID